MKESEAGRSYENIKFNLSSVLPTVAFGFMYPQLLCSLAHGKIGVLLIKKAEFAKSKAVMAF